MRDLNNPLSQSKFDPPKKERNKRSTPKSTGYLHGQYLTKTGENTYFDAANGYPKSLMLLYFTYYIFSFKLKRVINNVTTLHLY